MEDNQRITVISDLDDFNSLKVKSLRVFFDQFLCRLVETFGIKRKLAINLSFFYENRLKKTLFYRIPHEILGLKHYLHHYFMWNSVEKCFLWIFRR